MKLFTLFLGVQGITRDPAEVKCQSTIGGPEEFGSLKYISKSHVPCQTEINKIAGLTADSCAKKPTTFLQTDDAPIIEEIRCSTTESKCPASTVQECELETENPDDPDGDSSAFCYYKCTQVDLVSPCNENFAEEIMNKDESTIFCFDKTFDNCEFKTMDGNDTNQIDYTCSNLSCGYLADSDEKTGFSLFFDGTKFVNIYEVDVGVADDAFGCDLPEPTKYGFGCQCNKANGGQETSIECPASAYTNQCTVPLKCVLGKDICYKGTPIVDYTFDDCLSSTNEGLGYCKRDMRAELPCGDEVQHACVKNTSTDKYDCDCDVIEDDCGDITNAEWKTKCVIESIVYKKPISECSKTCFNETFDVEVCIKEGSSEFSSTYWQCFDDFMPVKITKGDEYFSAQKSSGEHKDLSLCPTADCFGGNCVCDDEILEKASERCGSDYFVREKPKSKILKNINLLETIDPEEETAQTLDFQCLAFSEDHIAINFIDSNCTKLEKPKNSVTAECPSAESCRRDPVHEFGETEAKFGFYECACEKECTYKCSEKNHEAIFPENKDENDPYTKYSCEKDNLVMIICTSIFVPLGVFGIAGGVYFFFFYESSEVAPVETDNELGSSADKSEIKEDNKTENQSEIQETTDETN